MDCVAPLEGGGRRNPSVTSRCGSALLSADVRSSDDVIAFCRPFIPHAHLRSAESIQLAKKKTLGMRGPRNFTPGNNFVRVRTGMAGPAADPIVACEPLVLWHPGDDENAPEGAAPIELENFLCHWLRPHQRIGVQFLFDCVTGQ